MSAETKLVFDQLTEDAMKLMENGEYGKVSYFVGLAFSAILIIVSTIYVFISTPSLLSTEKICFFIQLSTRNPILLVLLDCLSVGVLFCRCVS